MTSCALPHDASQPLDAAARADCHAVLKQHGKSFAMAVRLLGATDADRAAGVYAYCRRVDDAIDCCAPGQARNALSRLVRELDAIYGRGSSRAPDQRAFQELVASRALPKRYPLELLKGMAMDVNQTSYETLQELLVYCHRVAGVVGLMMCHAFGVRREAALVQAAQLGIAMQLTNICRDVSEDLARGRLYLPRAMLRAAGAPRALLAVTSTPELDGASRAALARVTAQLLEVAEAFYRAGERGIDALPFRAGLAVRVARRLYAAIGDELEARGCDPTCARAVVSARKKRWLVALASVEHLTHALRAAFVRGTPNARVPRITLALSAEILAPATRARSAHPC